MRVRRALGPTCLKEHDVGTFRLTAWWPMSGPGGRSSPGPPPYFDPRSLPFPEALEAYRFLSEGRNAASLKQIRAALSFAYKHWDLKNPFASRKKVQAVVALKAETLLPRPSSDDVVASRCCAATSFDGRDGARLARGAKG